MSEGRVEAFVEIGSCAGIEAVDDVSGGVIVLGFYRKGVATLLTYAEALALGRVLRRIAFAIRRVRMAAANKGNTHEREIIEVVDSETIAALEHTPYGTFTLQFCQRGLSLDLTYEEAAALGVVVEKVVEYVKTKR